MLGEKPTARIIKGVWSTRYNRWGEEFRPFLFDNLKYIETSLQDSSSSIPKIGSKEEAVLIKKIAVHPPLSKYRAVASDADIVYYHSGGRYFRKCIREQLSNEYKQLPLRRAMGDIAICLLSSSFYYWYWIAISDCYHVTKRDIDALPIPDSLVKDDSLRQLAEPFLLDLRRNAKSVKRKRADSSEQIEVNFQVSRSKPIVDKIDKVLAKHYGFTMEELDLIINYDSKYRWDNADD
jgi:hypothetical protein